MPARSVVSTNMRAGAVPAVPSGTVSPSARIGIVGCASETDGTAATAWACAADRPAACGAGCAGRAFPGVGARYAGVCPPSGSGVPSACGADPAAG